MSAKKKDPRLSLEEIKSDPELAKQYVKRAWLNLPDLIGREIDNPLAHITREDIERPHKYLVKLITDVNYVHFTAKHIFNVKLSPMQVALIRLLWDHPFPLLVGSRGMSKTFTLAFYVMYKGLIKQGSKIILTGAGFRQSKLLSEYGETIWYKADILRDLLGDTGARGLRNGPHRNIDRHEMILADSVITALPIGNGEKIRGLRANTIVADEFDAIDTEIFETVIKGFTVVSDNPIENMERKASYKAMQELGFINEDNQVRAKELFESKRNQVIISGTASYSFRNFAKYWKKYKAIISSKGNQAKLAEMMGGDTENMAALNWKDYCIIRIPVDLLQEGYFDATQIASNKATLHKAAYEMEYGAVFVGDSDGFFKRTLVETCVTRHPIYISGIPVQFSATIKGHPKRRYVYGIDPASERDNFAITLLELWPEHRRVVYVWTTDRKRFKEKFQKGIIKEHQFYAYCARKIRELMKTFPCERIVMDAEGGGREVAEALYDTDKMYPGELPIWPVRDPDEPKDSDSYAGLHLVELVNFSDGKWVSEANHGMKKDFEDKVLLLPRFDAVEIQLAGEEDNQYEKDYGVPREDTLEDCMIEIEELKEELASIQHTQTSNGRERWDTPEIKTPGMQKKGRLRKDRYSALLIANMAARTIQRAPEKPEYHNIGGVVGQVKKEEVSKSQGQSMYLGAHWYSSQVDGNCKFSVIVRS
jgi:hypothetical protein